MSSAFKALLPKAALLDWSAPGLNNYRFEECVHYRTLRKKDRDVELKEIPLYHVLSVEKRNYVQKLLEEHFGKNWKINAELRWYRYLLES